ncbi:MAG: hypothetical protein PHW53_01310 [Patescibacteria group bacterium]|nr:hypothetical protein [Patescibacteria group bacterium]
MKKSSSIWTSITKLVTHFFTDASALFTILHDDVETIVVELVSRGIAEARELRRVLFRTVWRLVILWTLGVVTGYLGHVWGVIWLMNLGRIIIAFGSLGFAAMLAYLWFRTAIFAEVLVILAGAIEKIPLPKLSFPGIKLSREGDKLLICSSERFTFDWTHVQTGIGQAKAGKLLRQLMSVMAWLAVLGIYASVFPVYTNPFAFLVVLLIALFIGFATVGWELKSPWSRRVALAFVGFVLLATTINFGQSLLRGKQYNHHLRTQIVYADLYDKYAMAVEGYVDRWGIGIEDQPSPVVRQDPSTRCDQCVDGMRNIVCDCKLPIPGMTFSSSCTTRECLKARDELYLNNARLDYREELGRLAKLDAKLRPGTPIEFWNYGMSVMGVGYAKAKAELKELRTRKGFAVVAKTPTVPTTTSALVTPAAPAKTQSTLIISAADPVEPPPALSDEGRAKLEAKLAELRALKVRVQAIE